MHNTGNPLGSKDILDLYDNSETIDNFVNSQQDEVPDRFGTKRLTLAGLTKRSMALRNEINDFSGALTFKPEWSDVPMNVSEGVGGEGGALNLQAEALGNRSEINKVTSREALRRSYAEAGYNLVDGSFEVGGTLVNANDVLLHEASGKAYSGVGPFPQTVIAGTNPMIGGFVDRSGELLATLVNQQIIWVTPQRFGAIGDGLADDTAAIKNAIAFLKSVGGGTLAFPNGTYKVTDEILIDSPSIRFYGSGRRKAYPGLFVPTKNTVPTIMPVHSKPAAVRFFNAVINVASSFSAEGVNLATLETGAMPTCAFGFDGSGNFHRDYTFDKVGIHGFTSAIDTYNTGGDTAFGAIKITKCAINRNGYIARNLTGQWNGFVFEQNEAGQNLTGGIDIKAQACSILRNMLEGQPNAVRVTGNYRATIIEGNYFEQNSGAYVIQLKEVIGATVGPNFWQNITATEQLSLIYDVGTTVLDRVIPSSIGSFDLRTAERSINPVPLGSSSAAFYCNPSFIKSMLRGFTEVGGNVVSAPAGPHYDIPGSAGSIYTSNGTGLTAITESGLSIPSGNYIGVAFCVSYKDAPALPPRLELRVNSTNTQGYTNPTFYNFDKAAVNTKNKTVLYFGVVKALADVTTFQTFMYPFGLNPTAGLVCYVSPVAVYDLGASIPLVANAGSGVQAFIPDSHVQRVNAAPVSGTWPIGYKLYAGSPAAAGHEGWICTTAGTPGVWKQFGAILA